MIKENFRLQNFIRELYKRESKIIEQNKKMFKTMNDLYKVYVKE